MISEKKVQNILEKIFNSKPFSGSEFDQKLLKYLVEQSLNDTSPKETTIAIEMFNKDDTFDPAGDSIVRTHMYSLRKKLREYYLSEGRGDRIRLQVPRGRYEIRFITNPDTRSRLRSHRVSIITTVSATLLFCALFAVLVLKLAPTKVQNFTGLQNRYSGPILKEFIESGIPTTIVLGDYFVFVEKNYLDNGVHRIRSGRINSLEDLQAYYDCVPQYRDRFLQEVHTYLDINVVRAGDIVKQLFDRAGLLVSLDFASYITEQEVTGQNLIFIGPLETLRFLRDYVQGHRIEWTLNPGQILIRDHREPKNYEKVSIKFDEDNRYYKNYGLLIKIPGPDQNTLLFITAFSPRALTTMVDHITEGILEKKIRQKYIGEKQQLPPFFEALFEYNTVNDIVTFEIMEFFPIHESDRDLSGVDE